MSVSGSFFSGLRQLAVTLERETRQLERALNREERGEARPRAGRVGGGSWELKGREQPACVGHVAGQGAESGAREKEWLWGEGAGLTCGNPAKKVGSPLSRRMLAPGEWECRI